jgi:hypothetical protein
MTRHFAILIPSTNTTVEAECRLLPPAYQAHIGRLLTSAPGQPFSPSRDDASTISRGSWAPPRSKW